MDDMIVWMFFQGRIDDPNNKALQLPRFATLFEKVYNMVIRDKVFFSSHDAQEVVSRGNFEYLSSLDQSLNKFSAALPGDR